MADSNDPPTNLGGARYWFTWGFAVMLAVFFIVGSVLLFLAANDTEVTETLWSRYVYVFSGFEAIVFTAVGWIFGREVNRTTAETATRQAEIATNRADAATKETQTVRSSIDGLRDEAAKGRHLAEAVRSFTLPRTRTVPAGGTEIPVELTTLSSLADRLFPPPA